MSDVVVFSVSPVTIDVECTLCTNTINVSLDSLSTYYTEQKKTKQLLDATNVAAVCYIYRTMYGCSLL